MKYDPVTQYFPAFDDGELVINYDSPFTDEKVAALHVKNLNTKERERLKGANPDTLWFVAKLESRVTIAWSDRVPVPKKTTQPKKRVVRKPAAKK